jgi:arylformamidase
MTLYDVTLPLREGMVAFPGDPPFRREPVLERSRGDPCEVARLTLGSHLGTHVDPPSHYLEGGATVDRIPLEALMGPGVVLDLRGMARVDRPALERSPLGDECRVLLKTDNGSLLVGDAFTEDYVHLTEDGAQYLVERGVVLVGIDAPSIEAYQSPGARVHKTLMSAGVVILEGIDLRAVPAGACHVICLPLRVEGGDGAPARVIIGTD